MAVGKGEFEARCRASFARQQLLKTLGETLASAQPGEIIIDLPFRSGLTQQHGFLHAGVPAAISYTACGYAALSLKDPDAAVLTVEFKLNLLRPAAGGLFRAVGKAIRVGHTLTVCTGEVCARRGDKETEIAIIQATLMSMRGRGIAD